MRKIFLFSIILMAFFSESESQSLKEDDKTAEIMNWTLLQMIPNPVFFHDGNETDSRLRFGLRWNITPVNISFFPNKYVSRYQFLKIDPVRRFTGSVELIVQPEITTGEFKYSNLEKFGISTGLRAIFPVLEKGENLAVSIGGKLNYRKEKNNGNDKYYGIETGVYFFGGIVGLQFNKNFNSESKYNFSFYLKYF